MSRFVLICVMSMMSVISVYADPIDELRAKSIAADFVVTGNEPLLVKRAVRNEARARRLAPAVRQTAPYYIFSRGEGKGYVIVSGDDCLPLVLGYTETGDYEYDDMSPTFKSWLGYYQQRIEEVQEAGLNHSRTAAHRAAARRAKGWGDIPAMITTHWHQTWPYNNRCPIEKGTTNRSVAGCVAIAGTQVVKFFYKDNPNTLLASTQSYDWYTTPVTDIVPKGTPMKWGLMLDSYSSNSPEEYCEAVSDFVFALGAANHLDYSYSKGTAGQISDLVATFSNYFNLNSECVYKSDGSTAHIDTETWEKMLYDDLAKGRPNVYTGFSSSEGGHAVVVDGYQSKTGLFHFNFGWGGQGDGWYTVDDETGMNHFNMWQGMTYKVSPKQQNLQVSLSLPEGFYVNHDNLVRISVANNGTLNYSGIYVFLSANDSKPTSISSARAKDESTVIVADGESVNLALKVKPTSARTWYITVTDANRNVLAQKKVESVAVDNQLQFNRISLLCSSDTEQHAGEEYSVVYGELVSCLVNLSNLSSHKFQDRVRLNVYSSDDDGETFTLVGTKTNSNSVIDAKSSGDIEYTLSNSAVCPIVTDKLYYVALANPVSTSSNSVVNYAADADTIARFVMHKPTDELAATLDGTTLRFSGQWNPRSFSTLTIRQAFTSANAYDLTSVSGVGQVPDVEGNPNAYIYVAADSKATGKNVVRPDNTADEISLTTSNDFKPSSVVHAAKASLTLNLSPNMWHLLTVPFTASVPMGMVAKSIDAHGVAGIGNHTSIVSEMQGGHTYLVMVASTETQTISAKNVDVVDKVAVNIDEAVVGTFEQTIAPVNSFYINDESTQFFKQSTIEYTVVPFSGFIVADDISGDFRANSNLTIDPNYRTLGETISQAYQAISDFSFVVTEQAKITLLAAISDAEKVFTDRTIEKAADVKIYYTSLLDAIDGFKLSLRNNLKDEFIEMTQMIQNPSFEVGTVASSKVGSTKGWTINGTGVAARLATDLTYRGVGAHGNYLAYSYNSATAEGSGIEQAIENLPAGLYVLTAKVGTAPNNTVTIFANEQTVTVEAHPFGQYYLSDARIDSIVVATGASLTLGVKAGHWYKADDFRLYYVRSLTAEEDPVGIECISTMSNDNVSVRVINGGVSLTTTKSQTVTIYSVTGSQVWHSRVNGTSNIQLPIGLYIVNGKKVLVR